MGINYWKTAHDVFFDGRSYTGLFKLHEKAFVNPGIGIVKLSISDDQIRSYQLAEILNMAGNRIGGIFFFQQEKQQAEREAIVIIRDIQEQ